MLIGIDLGQGAVKVTALGRDGAVLGMTTEEYPTAHPRPGWSEQDARHWVGALGRAARRLMGGLAQRGVHAHDAVEGIGISSATHHAVLLDARDRPVRPCIMLTDGRAVEQARGLMAAHGPLILERTRNVASAGWTLPQLLWVQEEEPEAWARVTRMVFAKDYLRFVLTGEWATDWIDAEGSLLFHAEAREWDADLCRIAGVKGGWLPRAVAPVTVTGTLTREGEQLLGIAAGTPVVAGCSDTAAEAVAAGACADGQAVIKLATAGNVNVITSAPRPRAEWFTYSHPVAGLAYHALGTNSAASSQRWIRDVLGGSAVRYEDLDTEAGRAPAGADGVLFHPYLLGERAPYWDPGLRASFVGLRAAHRREHLLRAILEGVALSLADCLGVYGAAGVSIESARIIGGGARSALWREIVADVLGLTLIYPSLSDASAGAALIAGAGVGVYRSLTEAVAQTVRVEAEHRPDARRHAGYVQLLEVYREVQRRLAPIGPALAGVRFE